MTIYVMMQEGVNDSKKVQIKGRKIEMFSLEGF